MRWSWKVGRVFGIDVYVHATFLLLLAWQALSQLVRGGTPATIVGGVVLTLLVFAIVVMHELGHALTARSFGIRTRDITLLPIGGVARLERMPEKPSEELLVALAGPAVNVALAALLFAAHLVLGSPVVPEGGAVFRGAPMLTTLLWVNVALAVFNMLPAFPMDGGRVLRALLALRLDYVRATRLAAQIGQGFAFALAIAGMFANPMLVLVAVFVWMGAAAEAGMVETKAVLHALPVHLAMSQNVVVLPEVATLDDAARSVMAGAAGEFPVIDERGRLVGVLTRAGLVGGLSRFGPLAQVRVAMERTFAVADPYEMLDVVLARLQESECPVVPVVRDGRVLGVVTLDNIGQLIALQSAARTGRQRTSGVDPRFNAPPRASLRAH